MAKVAKAGASARVAWVALGIASATGCAGVSRSITPPGVELVGLAALGSQRFALTFLLTNPNAEAIPVEEIRYSVRLAGQGYLNGRSSAPVLLAGAGGQTLRVELTSAGVASAATLRAFAAGPEDALEYELAGDLVLGGRPRRLLRFSFDGDVPLALLDAD